MAKASDGGRLQRELKKRHGFQSTAQEAWLNLLRTTAQLTARFDRLFTEHGLTGAQYNVLRILRGEGGPLPILEIAQRMIARTPGITGLVDRLEEAGLVKRTRSLEDRRVVYVEATPVALERLRAIDRPLDQLHRDVMRPLDESRQRTLIELLETLRAADDRATDAVDGAVDDSPTG